MFDAKKLLDAMMAASQSPSAPGARQGGGLADMLGGVLSQVQQGGTGGSAAGGGLGGLLGAVLGQATQGLQTAGRDTGATQAINDILGKLAGGPAGDLAGRAKGMAQDNPFASGAALGSLAGLFLGTKAGRGLALDTAKLGGLALIGGLAYQAFRNYQAGKPPLALPGSGEVQPAPAASPFGETGDAAADQAHATVMLRAMIAAASADGVVDDVERGRIVGGLRQLGLSAEAAAFLEGEFARPATPMDLAALAEGPEEAVEIYTAARLTVDPDTREEQDFLASLADQLGIDAELRAHIDAAAESAKVSESA
ncbi:tellurite resistance TerB family protein [Alsobacter sp. R-9]